MRGGGRSDPPGLWLFVHARGVVPDLGGVACGLREVTGLLAGEELPPVRAAHGTAGDGYAVQQPGVEATGELWRALLLRVCLLRVRHGCHGLPGVSPSGSASGDDRRRGEESTEWNILDYSSLVTLDAWTFTQRHRHAGGANIVKTQGVVVHGAQVAVQRDWEW